jgi:hypothetical protein
LVSLDPKNWLAACSLSAINSADLLSQTIGGDLPGARPHLRGNLRDFLGFSVARGQDFTGPIEYPDVLDCLPGENRSIVLFVGLF